MRKPIPKAPSVNTVPHEQEVRLTRDLDNRLKETADARGQTIETVIHDALLHPYTKVTGIDLREQVNASRPSNVLRTILLLPDVYEKVVDEAFRYDLSPNEVIRAKLREHLIKHQDGEKAPRTLKS